MTTLPLILSLLVPMQASAERKRPPLEVRAERGVGGVQTEGWQHITLRLVQSTDKPITGRATLYEWDQQAGARPRIVQPFEVTDRRVLHFYPFRPPEAPAGNTFLITLTDDAGQPIPFDGGAQFVIEGQSTRAIRVEGGDSLSGDFRIGIWGDATSILRPLIEDWTPADDETYRNQRGIPANRQQLLRRMAAQRGSRFVPDSIALEQPHNFPDNFIGYGQLDVLLAVGVDLESLTDKQRRALVDWVHSGGYFVFVPRRSEQLATWFWRELAGVRLIEETITPDDSHLARFVQREAGAPHTIVHFLTQVEPGREIETTVSYQDRPVVFSVPTGFGRTWIVAFDPDAHGGIRRYHRLWVEILNQTARHKLRLGTPPASLAAHAWSADSDQTWLAALGERFGRFPSMESLAALIVGYLLVIGPVNYFVLKRREARVWLIGTVPVLAGAFGAVVLSMGYVSHGMRATANQMALAIVTPEGDRAYVEEHVGVYGTTSAEYRLGFPRNLPVRPLGEFVANPNGGFDSPASFKLVGQDDRTWLEGWRLSFWQTRGTATTDCVQLGGRLRAARTGRAITIANEAALVFDVVTVVSSGGIEFAVGPMVASESRTITLAEELDEASADGRLGSRVKQTPLLKGKPDSTPAKNTTPADGQATPADGPASEELSGFDVLRGPEASRLRDAAKARMRSWEGAGRFWVLGLTRQPIHRVDSPDAKRHDSMTLYAWPVIDERFRRTSRERSATHAVGSLHSKVAKTPARPVYNDMTIATERSGVRFSPGIQLDF